MKAKQIIDILNTLAPEFLIDSWDNSGLQIGSQEIKVEKILISLDLSKDALDLAIEEKVNMIVTHHPFLFTKLTKISLDDEKGKMIRDIIKNDITVVSMHTNLDICEGGVNDALCEKLDIKNKNPLSEFLVDKSHSNIQYNDCKTYGYGRIGEIEEEMTLLEFSNKVNEKLNCHDLRVYGKLDKVIKKVAVCGGSGAGFIKDAYKAKVDAYVTGDIKYHDAQLAKELGVVLLDAGHFETERIAVDLLKEYLNKNTEEIEIITLKESMALFSTFK